MKQPSFLFLAIAILVVFGCDSDSGDSNPTPEDVLMPLSIGSKWIFACTFYDSTGVVQNQFPFDLRIEGESTRDGKRVYLDQWGDLFANRSDGLWVLDDSNTEDTLQLAFKYPCQAGDTFPSRSFIFTAGDSELFNTSVASINETITVGAGTYSCIKYISEGYDPPSGLKTDRRIYYFSPKVGLILVEDYTYWNHPTNPYLYWRYELTELVLK